MVWLIAAGLHPRATATTQRIADDLADRMDYDTGHVRYCLTEMAARLGIDRSTVARHVSYLRELGALAWVQHGSRTNVHAAKGRKGYAATATIYAAAIPAVYDHAMGHTVVGSGYEARIVIDQRTQNHTQTHNQTVQNHNDGDVVDEAVPVDNPPVENPAQGRLATPSLTLVKEESQVQMVGGFNYTSQARPPKARIPRQSSLINGQRRTATDVKKASNTTRLVRALVNWTQPVPLRELEFVLRPWTDRGWDALRIADELNGMCAGVRWRPKNPLAFIRARITADTRHQTDLTAAVAWEDSTAARNLASLAALFGPATPELEPERTDDDRKRARLQGWDRWWEVADHYDDDPDDALDLYGTRLCSYAVGRAARQQEKERTYA